jgi:hypothetical protein
MMRLTKDKIIGDTLKVEFVYLFEGYHGDYNPNDPEDKPLLRFDVSVRKSRDRVWEQPDDTSYCTQMWTKTSDDDRKWVLLYMYSVLEPLVKGGKSLKRACEKLSWITPTSVEITKFKIGNMLMVEAEKK